MAKYIERELLPQFKYYHSYADKECSWNVDFNDGANCYVGNPNGFDRAFDLKKLGLPELFLSGERENVVPNPHILFDCYSEACDLEEMVASDIHNPAIDECKLGIEDMIRSGNEEFCERFREALIRSVIKEDAHKEKWISRIKNLVELFEEAEKHSGSEYVVRSVNYYAELFRMGHDTLKFFEQLQVAQGHPYINCAGNTLFPKLLLLDADLYKKCKNASNLRIDYNFLKEQTRHEAPVIVINGDSAEKKMVFTIINEEADSLPSDTDDGYIDGDFVKIFMLDPANGLSGFFVGGLRDSFESDDRYAMIGGNDAVRLYERSEFAMIGMNNVTLFDSLSCHPRGDYFCDECKMMKGNESQPMPSCVYTGAVNTCKRRMLNIISAVLYCYVEYKKKILNQKADRAEKYEAARDRDKTQPFVPTTMVKVYDVKMTDDEYARVDKYGYFSKHWSAHVSTEKCPHIRRGTMRYNPKTGKKDIKVSGSIIHKDKFLGFTTADRLKE